MTLTTHGSNRAHDRPAVVGDADRLGVLETRLSPPYPRKGLVVRHGLLKRLAGIDEPIVAFVAPAGYGKSIVLSQWAHRTGRPVAWLSADERDDDPATFLRGIAAAVDRAVGLDVPVIESVASPGTSVWSTAIPRLAAALRASRPFILCVDDVDRIGDREALDVLITLAKQLPPTSSLGVAGRGTGLFPIARLVSQGQVVSIGRDALALDLGETHAVVLAAGSPMSTDAVAQLHERTEGWPAGVYLSALAARGRDGAPDGPARDGHDDRLIEEYLWSEVLATTSDDDTDLLLRASVLERINGPLCDAVLERTGSGVALARLERANLFLIPLDHERTWFRFHHLLTDLLRAELARRDPDAADRLRRRAAEWHEAEGLLEPALEYAIAAEDVDRAVMLVVRLIQPTLNAGRLETLRRWFGWLERRQAGRSHPRLGGLAAITFALSGDATSADRWLDEVDLAVVGADPADPFLAFLHAFLCRDGVERMRIDAAHAVATMPADDPFRVAAIGSLGLALQLTGDVAAAEAAFTESVALWEQRGTANYAAILALVNLADIAIERGDWAAAATHARRGRSIVIANGLQEQAPGAASDAVNARISLHHGATEHARTDATHARRLRALLTTSAPWLAIRLRLDLIRVDLGLGDPGGARTLLAEVREILEHRPDMGRLVDETAELERRVAAMRGGVAGASTLTLAELRLLPLLTTHLSFREIGERLFVSQNTVKTQAISIYRKLDATSRSEAVARATDMGLLDRPAERPSAG